MTELKTLKDWRKDVSTLEEYKIHRIQIFRCEEWLRAEAVKWIKELEKTNKDNYDFPRGKCVDIGDLKDVEVDWEESSEIYGMIKILKHFFNLTEEDLK